MTFQRKMGEPRWMKTFTRMNRPGAFLRVLVETDGLPDDLRRTLAARLLQRR